MRGHEERERCNDAHVQEEREADEHCTRRFELRERAIGGALPAFTAAT